MMLPAGVLIVPIAAAVGQPAGWAAFITCGRARKRTREGVQRGGMSRTQRLLVLKNTIRRRRKMRVKGLFVRQDCWEGVALRAIRKRQLRQRRHLVLNSASVARQALPADWIREMREGR